MLPPCPSSVLGQLVSSGRPGGDLAVLASLPLFKHSAYPPAIGDPVGLLPVAPFRHWVGGLPGPWGKVARLAAGSAVQVACGGGILVA